jgi:polysaccharide export outer membrane protein
MTRNNRLKLVASLLGVLLTGLGQAQVSHQNESLIIGPGDQVHITVFEVSELEQHAKVTDSGDIKLILGGEVHVGGQTPILAARLIENVLKQKNYLVVPHVAVAIERYATQTVSILGAVKTPSTYPMDTSRSIVDVLAAAGGLMDSASRRITIRRKSTGEKISYFLSNSPDATLDNMPAVYPGDTVFVPVADKVYMIGDFNRPGAYTNTTDQPSITVLQALALAGSTPPTAVPSNAKLIRKLSNGTYETVGLNISAIQKGKLPDLPLQPDDVIYIPFSYFKNVAISLGAILASAASATVYQF